MDRTLRGPVVVVACALLTGGAATASADWTVAGYLGAGSTVSSALRIVQPSTGIDLTFNPVEWRGESFTPPVYYGYRLGYVLPFASRLAVEAEFIHLKVYAETRAVVTARGRVGAMAVDRSQPLDATVQGFSISHGANFVLANVAYRQRLGGASADRATPLPGQASAPPCPTLRARLAG